MNKNTIVLICIVVGILILAYVVWKHNEFFKTQSQINSLLKDRFPEIGDFSKKSDKEVLQEKLRENIDSLKDKARKIQGFEEDIPENSENQNISTESEDAELSEEEYTPASESEIASFAFKIKDMEELSDPADMQFYENNKQRIETALQAIASRDSIKPERSELIEFDSETTQKNDITQNDPRPDYTPKLGRGRHKDICTCPRCIEKKKNKAKKQ